MTELECRVCGAEGLEEFADFAQLPRVTSDCKPFPAGGRIGVCGACGAVQRPNDARWRADIAAIYGNYEIYFQSEGVEQAVFDPKRGEPHRRSAVLLDRVSQVRPLPSEGALLDVGCGKGAFLSAFGEFRPNWRLFGHELSPQRTEVLGRIPGFKQLYSGPIEHLPGGFDIIALMHSLEHFADPLEGLRQLRDKLGEDGRLLIEVPNAAVTPFDLIVADHASHFTKQDLATLLGRAEFGSIVVADDWITKELSGVGWRKGSRTPVPASPNNSRRSKERVKSQLDWLQAVLKSARQSARSKPGKFGVFGTSIAGMWLLGELQDQVAFFVDEDPSRQHALLGRPVFSPDQVPDGSMVYLALIPQVARAVAGRLERPNVAYERPPDLATP